jgi:hypothetical protein
MCFSLDGGTRAVQNSLSIRTLRIREELDSNEDHVLRVGIPVQQSLEIRYVSPGGELSAESS